MRQRFCLIQRSERTRYARSACARVGKDDDGRSAGLELEPSPVVENRGGHATHRRQLRRGPERCRAVEREIPSAGWPDLDLDRRRTPQVTGRSAVAVDERDELGRVGATQHGDERVPFDAVAREEQRVFVEPSSVVQREPTPRPRLRLRLRLADRPCTGARQDKRRERGCSDNEKPVQWFTWCSEMNAVQPSDAA